jgi:nucleotide-binding universal stress UspA family protein
MSAKSISGQSPGFLVVGVDGSAGAVHALRWATAVAARSGDRLVVIHAWEYLPPATSTPLGWTVQDRPRQLAAARRELASCLRAVFGSAAEGEGSWTVDGLTVQALVGEGSAWPVLCAAATGAIRLVVGARADPRRRDCCWARSANTSRRTRPARSPSSGTQGWRPRAGRPRSRGRATTRSVSAGEPSSGRTDRASQEARRP